MKAGNKQVVPENKPIKKSKKKQQSDRSLRKDEANTSMTKKGVGSKYEHKLSKTFKSKGSKF